MLLPSQSSTSPTAPPNARPPSCGPSSNKRRHPPGSGLRHGGIDVVGAARAGDDGPRRIPCAIAVAAAGLASRRRLRGKMGNEDTAQERRSGQAGVAVGWTPTLPSTACALYHTLHATMITRFPFLLHRAPPPRLPGDWVWGPAAWFSSLVYYISSLRDCIGPGSYWGHSNQQTFVTAGAPQPSSGADTQPEILVRCVWALCDPS